MKRVLNLSIILALVAALLVGLAPVQAQTRTLADLEAYIADVMAMYNLPGLAVGVIKDGEVALAKGYGTRNTENEQPVTPETLFSIASVTKSFTALGIMEQVQAGKLDLDTPIVTYLPDFKLSDEKATRSLTLRQALSMTSGLPRADNVWYFADRSFTREDIIQGMANIRLTTEPGRLFQYNNQNFVLAGYLIERLTGQSWEDYTQAKIFDPLGMKTANFSVEAMQQADDFAAPHRLDVRKGMTPLPLRDIATAIGPAGAINASLNDLLAYARFQIGDGEPLLSRELLTEMHTRQAFVSGEQQAAALGMPTAEPAAQPTAEPTAQATPEGTPDPADTPIEPFYTDFGYALGWFTQTFRGTPIQEHGGNLDGFTSTITLIPSAQGAVVLLTNADLANAALEAIRLPLVEYVLDLASERDYVADINRATQFDPEEFNARLEAAREYSTDWSAIEPLLGDYNTVVGTMTLFREGDTLFFRQRIEATNYDIELVPFEPNTFLGNTGQTVGMIFRFETDAEGTINVYQNDTRIGQRLAAGTTSVEVKDPLGKFTIRVPQDLAAVPLANLLIVVVLPDLPQTNLLTFAAFEAQGDDLLANLERFSRQFDPTFNLKPDVTNTVTLNGETWTEYIYNLPSNQISVTWALLKDGTVYTMGYGGSKENEERLKAVLDTIAPTFTITAQ